MLFPTRSALRALAMLTARAWASGITAVRAQDPTAKRPWSDADCYRGSRLIVSGIRRPAPNPRHVALLRIGCDYRCGDRSAVTRRARSADRGRTRWTSKRGRPASRVTAGPRCQVARAADTDRLLRGVEQPSSTSWRA